MKKNISVKVFVLILFAAMIAVPQLVYSAIESKPIVFKPDAIEKRIDCLGFYLKKEKNIDVPENFNIMVGLDKLLNEIGEQGIAVQAEDSDRALNQAVEQILKKLMAMLGEDNPYTKIILSMLAELESLPMGYCEPEAYETPGKPGVAVRDLYDEREDYKDDPTPEEGNFIFYGKPYQLPDEARLAGNGLLRFSDEDYIFPDTDTWEEGQIPAGSTYPPSIAPLWILGEPEGEGDSAIPIFSVFEPPIVSSGESFFRYAYAPEDSQPFSATLYTNKQSHESDWIVFSYGDINLPPEVSEIFVGLIPGSGEDGHPGPGIPRGIAYRSGPGEGSVFLLDLSEEFGKSFDDQGGNYLFIGQLFENTAFDLADYFLVFRPDGDNKYTVTAGTREMIVDSLGTDSSPTSLDMAITNVMDSDLLTEVDTGKYVAGKAYGWNPSPDPEFPGIEDWPVNWQGAYKYGLQTVGSGGAFGPYNRIGTNGFLAYAVQVEEDRVNKEIINMARNADKLKLEVENIRDQLDCGYIRARDAVLTQIADAQSGRVTKDSEGHWVRSQQYILRPDPKTVQVLNVSLRGKDAGKTGGLSTMEFTTTFKNAYDPNIHGPLKNLPWSEWLRTVELKSGGHIDRMIVTRKSSGPYADAPALDNMYVKFANPSKEYLKEERTFYDRRPLEGINGYYYQRIKSEQLTVFSQNYGLESFTFSPTGINAPGQYEILHAENGFVYNFGDRSIPVTFYEAYDEGSNGPAELSNTEFKDIWDALRVNEPDGGAPSIGNKNLEISIDSKSKFLSKPIDIIYIPMSRMLWKTTSNEMPAT